MDTSLIAGPYVAPSVRKGDWLDDARYGRVQVGGYTDGAIAWPRILKTGRPALILCGDLERAVRTESVAAITHWWGVSQGTVWAWRQALGVDTTDGSQRIARRGVPEDAAARGRAAAALPEALARMSNTKRGKPIHPNTLAALRKGATAPRFGDYDTPFAAWRKRMGLTQRAAASALGVSYASLQDRERGVGRLGGPLPDSKLWRLACAAVEAGLDPIGGGSK